MWYNLSDDPVNAATEVVNIQALAGTPTLAQIRTQVALTDTAVVVQANEYELSGINS